MAALGLRGKSLLALLLACLLALALAILIGWQVLDSIRSNFGQAYARNTTLLNRERVFAPVSRELALAERFAGSELTRQWLLDEDNQGKRDLFFLEANGYQDDFLDQAYSIVSARSLNNYFNSAEKTNSYQPRYKMSKDDPAHSWFFGTLRNTKDYNINVDVDPQLGLTNIWINVVVYDGASKIGVAGTGINLTRFIDEFVATAESGVTPLIFDRQGAIQAHPQREFIALNSATGGLQTQGVNVSTLLDTVADQQALKHAMQAALKAPGSVELRWVSWAGREQLLALSYIPELRWYVATVLDLRAVQLIDSQLLGPVLLLLLTLLIGLPVVFVFAVERLVLKPLRMLETSAQSMASGNYALELPAERDDELGRLSAAFNVMAKTVRTHTDELEERVRERTSELEQANQEMVAARRKIDDSIDYASLIQRAILPDRHLVSSLGHRHAVLWKPRDVVGGDFYVYRALEHGCLFGVVDCAGHGVPGALMTMLAYAAIDQAIADVGLADPASILARADKIVRNMLDAESGKRALATNMDVGLAYVNLAERNVVFSGAKVALYFSDGKTVDELAGGRRAIGDKRVGEYSNQTIELHSGRTFYMATDGFLDQAGGEQGFGFGGTRFAQMILQHARLPLAEQGKAFAATLSEYQGEYEQRDDITMLCFHFE